MTGWFYAWLKEAGCVTVREVADRLGISEESARKRLRRLERVGAVERRLVGRVAVYCVRDAALLRPRTRGLGAETPRRIKQVCELLEREDCVPTSVLADMFGVDNGAVFYLMKHIIERRCAVKVVVGNTALWCRNQDIAKEHIARLREAVHRLAVENKMRYATPTKILQAALKDNDTYALLSRFVPLRRNARRFPPATLRFVNDILRTLYGEPLTRRHKTVYVVSQPREDYVINITDSIETHTVQVVLPDDLANALSGADVNELVLNAIEQLLQKYRT